MDVKIFWSKRADKGYARIVNYLEKNWTEREVRNFIHETRYFFELLRKNPNILEKSGSHKFLHRGSINRLTILTYRYDPIKKEITLINVRESRKKPLNE